MAKIIKAGNSLAITIPAKFIKKIGAKLGDEVTVNTKPEKGKLVVSFKNMRQLPLIR